MRILILEHLHPDGIARLRAASQEVVVALGLSRTELLRRVAWADVLVVRSVVRVDAELLSRAARLKAIARAGVGTDNIDLEEAAARGIEVLTVRGGNADAAADFAVMQILCLIRHAHQARQMMTAGDFRRERLLGRDLHALTVGIVGLGQVGSRVVGRLKGFGCRLLGCDIGLSPDECRALGVERVSDIDALIRQVDVLTLHVPLTPATRCLVSAEQFAQARPGLMLVNISRGAVVDETALMAAIRAGRVAAAALDVFVDEPPFDAQPGEQAYDNALLHVPEIISTPHMAAGTHDAERRIAENLAEQLLRREQAGLTRGPVPLANTL